MFSIRSHILGNEHNVLSNKHGEILSTNLYMLIYDKNCDIPRKGIISSIMPADYRLVQIRPYMMFN